ncbi:uncharacterized protein LOC114415979 [Glycine soja]|uniref:uncharacterized protein LOC114415979 n=1 Tax=Glycine soja TaxID=3848 RepID=UPI00103B13C3|nr:uncharacterized protein LOC114415979 [Glycine soja]
MVRTRGLGHALGRVIGRAFGRHDDHHADDVPQRRRPTASARRQQVVAPVAEDVPEMTEDVPEMSTDVPAPGAEGLASDGVEGSADDDAEGFPGGPRDPSMLTSFAEHVAYSIWSREEFPELKLVSHGRKVEKFGRPVPEIEGSVAAIGLTTLIASSVVIGDPGVIYAFVERWHKETSSFHLPVGEQTITLDDVASLLNLPITSAFHSFEPLLVDEAVIMLVELLEVSGEEARTKNVWCHGAYVRLSWLQDIHQTRCETQQWIFVARAYLLHLCWIYEHFPSVHNCVTDDGFDEMSPRACRWLTTKAYMKGLIASPYRTRIDALSITDMCLMPYGDHRGVRTIPPLPISATLSYDDIDDRWMHYSDHLAVSGQICLVPEQVSGDYMEWFFRISHPFMTPTQVGDQPRHPPIPQHEAYVELDIPEDACEGITERLECVLNLRIVTEGTELHEIMEDCLRIIRGVTSDGNVDIKDPEHPYSMEELKVITKEAVEVDDQHNYARHSKLTDAAFKDG